MFFFVAGRSLANVQKADELMGEHESGTVLAGDYPISRAVAASSAFPPVFPPLRLNADLYPNALTEYVTLTDGGVYDNLGVNPLLRTKRNPLDYCIVSDGGKPFAISPEPTEAGTIVLRQSIDILMEQVRGASIRAPSIGLRGEEGAKATGVFSSIVSKVMLEPVTQRSHR
ncbi:patatin-like phospholipase family protein [Sinorhizobium medicae]